MTDSERPSPTRRSAGPPLTEEEKRERTAAQIELVRQGLGTDNVRWDSGDSQEPADFNYLYRAGALLVRDAEQPDRLGQPLFVLEQRRSQEHPGGEDVAESSSARQARCAGVR